MSTHVPRMREKCEYMYKGACTGYTLVAGTGAPIITLWPRAINLDYQIGRCFDQTHPGPPYKCGGPVDIWKKTMYPLELGDFDLSIVKSASDPTNMYHTFGKWHPTEGLAAMSNPSGWLTTWGDGSSYGATAWNKYKPGKPGADLSVFIGELRDIPRMFQLRLRKFKDLGNLYLNYQFGWRPFLRDIRKFIDTTQKLAKTLQYFRNNNGKPVRRGGIVHLEETSVKSDVVGSCADPPPTGLTYYHYKLPLPSPRYQKVTYNYQKVWFDAVFQFWIPDIDSPEWISRVRRRLYGLNVSPSVVWELIPWSWLIDWFTNIGDIMSNLSSSDSADNLVARYAYLMTHTIQRVTYATTAPVVFYKKRYGINGPGDTWTPHILPWYIQWERKQRVAASPYGFSLSWPDFTLRQLAILAALAITRF